MQELPNEGPIEWAENDILVWVGRFLHKGGYGVVTRSTYAALKEHGCPLIGIDSQSGRPIDDSLHHRVTVTETDAGLVIKAKDEQDRISVVFHDVPPEWSRLSVDGLAHKVGSMYLETEQIPFGWKDDLLTVDRIWTATEFNRQVMINEGIPENSIFKLPAVLNNSVYKHREATLSFDAANAFRFLHIASTFNRKDFGGLIRAYCEAFSSHDDVSLVIKLPKGMSEDEFQRFISDAVYPWVDISSDSIPHIVLLPCELTDDKMYDLYSSCHAYVSLERGKGWDLPASEAMITGLPTLNLGWGANTEYQDDRNSITVESLERTTFSDETTVENTKMYSGHTWSSYDIHEAVKGFKKLRADYDTLRAKTRGISEDLLETYSAENVARAVSDYLASLETYEFETKQPAKVELLKRGGTHIKPTRKAHFKDIPEEDRVILNDPITPNHELEPGEWVERRRRLWGKYGPILPEAAEIDRLRSLRGQYFGESIFIVGNGPSLNKIDLSKLNKFYSFAANRIYLKFDSTDWRPDFYTALDWRVTPDNYKDINELTGPTLFYPNRFKGMLRGGDDVYWYESLSPGFNSQQQFEGDATKGVRGGGTVLTAAMQLAYYLGFRKIFLIGVDVSYSIPKTVLQSGGNRFKTGVQINLESTADDDVNHFDPRYFGKGAKWHDPNVDAMKRGFRSAYKWLNAAGAEVYNSTAGGNLDCIPRMAFDDAIEYAKPKIEQKPSMVRVVE